MAEPIFSKPKQLRLGTDYSKCLICQKSTASDNSPLYNLTETGYNKLKTAVETRTDDVAIRLSSEIINKSVFLSKKPQCHKSCKGNYTSTKSVTQKQKKTLVRQDSTSSTSSVDSESSVRSRSSMDSSSVNYKTQCFICERERSTTGNKTLRVIEMQGRQKCVWEKAKALNDEAMLHKIQGFGEEVCDMVACDFRYNDKCMNRYLNQRVPSKQRIETVTQTPYDQAFEKLIAEIDRGMNEENHIYYVTTLRNRYRDYLKEFGVENVETYRNSSLIERLNNFYNKEGQSQVNIIPQVGSSSVICSAKQNVGTLLKAITELKSQLDDSEVLDDFEEERNVDFSHEAKSICYNAAKLIQSELKESARVERAKFKQCVEDEQNESDEELNMDISYESAMRRTTNNLYNFVAWLVTDTGPEIDKSEGKVLVSGMKHEQVLNLCQDITAALTKMPTPKHAGIALHVLKETRSKDIVTMLNRFGNCISYTEAQRYINTMAVEADSQVERDGVFIPGNVKPRNFTQFAIDNLDFHEKTRDGKTLHATTQNIYQYPLDQESSTASVSGVVPLVKTRASSSKRTQKFEPSEDYLSAKERQKGKSVSGVTLVSEGAKGSSEIDDINLFWQFVRMAPTHFIHTPDDDISQPTWRSFNDFLIVKESPATIIGYGELIPKSPTDAAVVASSLEYCMSVANKVGQEQAIVTCDQAIYEIALGLRKKNPAKYEHLILRMGGFHIASNFLGAIGYLMRSSGIEDILSQAEICLAGTAKKIMSGKDYYLMVRAHTLISTAMFELLWEALENWLIKESAELDTIAQLDIIIENMLEVLITRDKERAAQVCFSNDASECMRDIREIVEGFRLTECDTPTAKLWLMYIDMVDILKRFIHAERAGIWKEHLAAAEEMLPYLVVAGHSKYVSCLPQYLQEMRLLTTTAPAVAAEFEKGSFTVRRATGRFNGVWTDMGLEQSYNCDAKTELFHGISQKPETMEKYLRVIPKLTAISEQTKRMVHMEDIHKHHEDSPGVSQRENAAVDRIKTVVREKMINPFQTRNTTDLLSISTGEKAPTLELITAKEKGIQILKEVQESESHKVPNIHIKAFEDKKKRTQTSLKKIQRIYEDESSVARSLFFLQDVTEEKKVEALSYEWTKYPTSLFEPDEELVQGYRMRKGVKSAFYTAIKDNLADAWSEVEELPSGENVVYIIDAMAFIQKHKKFGCATFHELQETYLDKIIHCKPRGCTVVNFVGDRYDFEPSVGLKQEEREKRGQSGSSAKKEYEPHDTLEIPDWDLISQNMKNKANLLDYIGYSWMENNARLPVDLKVVIGGLMNDPSKTIEITKHGCTELPELACKEHEEADTRMFAHAAYCVQKYGCDVVVFQATDTDIFVSGIYYCARIPNLKELWVQKDACIPIHQIVSALSRKYDSDSKTLSGTRLSVYVLSGCDTVSYPFNKGKKRVLTAVLDHLEDLSILGTMGESENERILTEEMFSAVCRLFSILYGREDFEGSADELRAHLYGHFRGDLRCLPPTEDALRQHALRALIQIIVSKSAHLSEPEIPDPKEYGRRVENERLIPTMMLKSAKPTLVEKPSFCKCKKGKCLRGCSCGNRKIRCTVSCICRANPEKCGRIAQLLAIREDSDEDE